MGASFVACTISLIKMIQKQLAYLLISVVPAYIDKIRTVQSIKMETVTDKQHHFPTTLQGNRCPITVNRKATVRG